MDSGYTIFIVDDVEAGRFMLESAFGQLYKVESFASGSDCLARVATSAPNLFMLDVDMPKMDGYSLCRQLKSLPETRDVPVIFISGLDDLESRMAGYDAGGDDYIAKPFKLALVKQKVEVLRRITEEKAALKNQLGESDMLASLVMSQLDEFAVLVKFLRSLNSCSKHSEIAEATLSMLRTYRLKGALQFRFPGGEITIDDAGESSPLEASIIGHVRSLGSITSFKNRTAFNFGRFSLLANNMPLEDADLCSRLRDNLAIAAETVDAKLSALLTAQENQATKNDIESMLKLLDNAVHAFSKKYENARFQSIETIRTLLAELDAEFAKLGVQEYQEKLINDLIQSKTDQVVDAFDFSAETEKTLKDLSARLGQALGAERS